MHFIITHTIFFPLQSCRHNTVIREPKSAQPYIPRSLSQIMPYSFYPQATNLSLGGWEGDSRAFNQCKCSVSPHTTPRPPATTTPREARLRFK